MKVTLGFEGETTTILCGKIYCITDIHTCEHFRASFGRGYCKRFMHPLFGLGGSNNRPARHKDCLDQERDYKNKNAGI